MAVESLDAETRSFREMINRWFSLTYALDNLNCSLGTRDNYPYILTPPLLEKLRVVHRVTRSQ